MCGEQTRATQRSRPSTIEAPIATCITIALGTGVECLHTTPRSSQELVEIRLPQREPLADLILCVDGEVPRQFILKGSNARTHCCSMIFPYTFRLLTIVIQSLMPWKLGGTDNVGSVWMRELKIVNLSGFGFTRRDTGVVRRFRKDIDLLRGSVGATTEATVACSVNSDSTRSTNQARCRRFRLRYSERRSRRCLALLCHCAA